MEEKNFVVDSIGHEIKATNQVIQRRMLSTAANAGIDKVTVMHGWIIDYLYYNRDKDIFQKDIESEFSISRSTVTNILKLMEKKGYIERESVDSDARLKKLVLTENGKEIREIIHQTIIDTENKFNSFFTKDERKTFLYLIRKFRKSIENWE